MIGQIFCAVAFIACLLQAYADVNEISVTFDEKTNLFKVVNSIDTTADAYGTYTRNYQNGGWNQMEVHMQEKVNSVDSHLRYSKAMGFLEGYVTCSDIKGFYNNFYSAVFGTGIPGKSTIAFLQENYKWMQEMAAKNGATDEYWYTVGATLQQLNGMYEGYVSGCGMNPFHNSGNIYQNLNTPTLEHFLLINAWGDLYQIASAFNEPAMNSRLFGQNRKDYVKSREPFTKHALDTTSNDLKMVERCSAMIKLLPDLSDVVYGHNTWDTYESMFPRILKHYNFQLMRNGVAAHAYDVYFSGSPSILSSVDDFFTVSGFAQLGVMETTNNLYNVSLLDLLTSESVLSWQRAVASNQLAVSGADWGQQFSRYHSGTYTNQWMALDLKLFVPGSMPQPGFLTVFEEVPGLVHVADQTAVLNSQTYWGSYNSPYYEDIRVASGYAALCEKNVDMCYETDPRAKLFRQYHSQVNNTDGGKWLLSYNNWQHDEASAKDSCNAIACRGDLEVNKLWAGPFGALDAKVTSAIASKRAPGTAPVIHARLGPTHDQQKVFCWSQLKDEADYSHVLAPDCFDFDWVVFPQAK